MKKFTSKNQKIGQIGEKLAQRFLMKQGFTLIDNNFSKRFGEIDIVCKKEDIFHFVEVKSVSCEMGKEGILSVRPEENMHEKKIQRFVRTCELYVLENNVDNWQVDLALVYIDAVKKQAKVRLLENIV